MFTLEFCGEAHIFLLNVNSFQEVLLGVLEMMTEPARKTSLENKHLRSCDYFATDLV